MTLLSGKRIVVTGGNSGIGEALVQQLLQYDNTKIMVVDKENSTKWEKAETSRVIFLRQDLSLPGATEEMFGRAKFVLGEIDIFIANAGFAIYDNQLQATEERINSLFTVNTMHPIAACHKLFNMEGEKHFVFVASAMAELALPSYGVYSASKAALLKFADAYHLHPLSAKKLTTVLPVATRTQFFEASEKPNELKPKIPWPSMTSDEVAKSIIKGIENNSKRVYPSRLNYVMRFFLSIHELIHKPYQWFYRH